MSNTADYFHQKYMSVKLDEMKRTKRLSQIISRALQALEANDLVLLKAYLLDLEEYVNEKG